jgi:hypothetical protein
MLLSFDIDCGYLIEGHRFIARGLEDNGMVDFAEVTAPAFSLEYELVPGVQSFDGSLFSFIVGISYQADVPLPFEPTDGGAIAPAQGGPSTHGSRGSWPLPRNARVLRFTLTAIDAATGFESDQPDGVLVVDLGEGTARWEPKG